MDSRPSDETLLLAVADRDMGAFRTLYERHASWLAIRLARRCNDRDLVADAIQDTFVLLPVCFVLLAAAAAFTLDEPASLVVDVTPTGPVRRTQIRAVALLAPLAAGALVLLPAALRGQALPWAAAGLALAGNVLAGFAVACVLRTRTGEPGPAAGSAVVLVLMAPSLVPQVARWVRTFPAPGAGGPSSDPVWWTVLAVCVVAIAISVADRSLPRWMTRVPYPRLH